MGLRVKTLGFIGHPPAGHAQNGQRRKGLAAQMVFMQAVAQPSVELRIGIGGGMGWAVNWRLRLRLQIHNYNKLSGIQKILSINSDLFLQKLI